MERLGCWQDVVADRAINTLEGTCSKLNGDYRYRQNAIAKCFECALDYGHTVFALQAGGWCASTVNAEDTYQKHGSADKCDKDGEGGPGVNEVYKITSNPGTFLIFKNILLSHI